MTSALHVAVGTQLKRPRRAASESIAVGVAHEDATYVHPDLAVLCGRIERHPDEATVVMNACAVFEILSRGAAVRDWNEKLPKYKSIPSIHTIGYVDHTQRLFTAWFRTEDGWEQVERREGPLPLRALELTLDVDALYDEAAEDEGP